MGNVTYSVNFENFFKLFYIHSFAFCSAVFKIYLNESDGGCSDNIHNSNVVSENNKQQHLLQRQIKKIIQQQVLLEMKAASG